jgi:hypothetical protein
VVVDFVLNGMGLRLSIYTKMEAAESICIDYGKKMGHHSRTGTECMVLNLSMCVCVEYYQQH